MYLVTQIDVLAEAARINSSSRFSAPVTAADIKDCVLHGGIDLDQYNNIALVSPFNNDIIAGGTISEVKENIITFRFEVSLREVKRYNLRELKTLNLQITDFRYMKDNYYTVRIKRAKLVPSLNEIQLMEPRKLDRAKQPSVMLI